jgi:hypothetical protein
MALLRGWHESHVFIRGGRRSGTRPSSYLTAAITLAVMTLAIADLGLAGSTECDALADTNWRPSEQFVWHEVCRGRTADLDEQFGPLDPRHPAGWGPDRRIRVAFLQTILFDERFHPQLPSRGVRVAGAWFAGPVDFVNAKLPSELRIERSRFEAPVYFSRVKTPFVLSFRGSAFSKTLQLDGISVGEVLDLRQCSMMESVDLTSAKVDRHVDFQGTHVAGRLRMDALHVGQSVFLRGGAEFTEPVSLVYGLIGLNLDLSGARLSSLNLTGTRIGGELRLGSKEYPNVSWTDGGNLVLRNVTASALQDWTIGEPWPKRLDLRGFAYDHFGGLGSGEAANDPEHRPSQWFVDWLARSPNSFQPYRQLARVLADSGQIEKGEDILFAGRERERRNSPPLKWITMTMAKVTIGYGYGSRYFYALAWAAGLVLLGALVLRVTGEGRRFGITIGLAYSFDMLLPIIRLRDWHYREVDLHGPARYYFYAHKIAGFLLGTFILAGIGGLTK